MIAQPNPPAGATLVVVPLEQLEMLLDRILAKRLRPPAARIAQQTEAPKAAFRTRKQAAEALGISLGTVNTRLHDGTIPFVRIGRRVLIPESFFAALHQQS
jgi:excisionase family DNA binding protein